MPFSVIVVDDEGENKWTSHFGVRCLVVFGVVALLSPTAALLLTHNLQLEFSKSSLFSCSTPPLSNDFWNPVLSRLCQVPSTHLCFLVLASHRGGASPRHPATYTNHLWVVLSVSAVVRLYMVGWLGFHLSHPMVGGCSRPQVCASASSETPTWLSVFSARR